MAIILSGYPKEFKLWIIALDIVSDLDTWGGLYETVFIDIMNYYLLNQLSIDLMGTVRVYSKQYVMWNFAIILGFQVEVCDW